MSTNESTLLREAMSRHGLHGQEHRLLKELEAKEHTLRKEIAALAARLKIAQCHFDMRRAAKARKAQPSHPPKVEEAPTSEHLYPVNTDSAVDDDASYYRAMRKEIAVARLRIAQCHQDPQRVAEVAAEVAAEAARVEETVEDAAKRVVAGAGHRTSSSTDQDPDDGEDYYHADLETGLSEEDSTNTLKFLELMSSLGMEVPTRLLSKLRLDEITRRAETNV